MLTFTLIKFEQYYELLFNFNTALYSTNNTQVFLFKKPFEQQQKKLRLDHDNKKIEEWRRVSKICNSSPSNLFLVLIKLSIQSSILLRFFSETFLFNHQYLSSYPPKDTAQLFQSPPKNLLLHLRTCQNFSIKILLNLCCEKLN